VVTVYAVFMQLSQYFSLGRVRALAAIEQTRSISWLVGVKCT